MKEKLADPQLIIAALGIASVTVLTAVGNVSGELGMGIILAILTSFGVLKKYGGEKVTEEEKEEIIDQGGTLPDR